MGIIENIIGGMAFYKMGCEVWNAFMDVALAFLLKTPEQVDSNLWNVLIQNIYPIFLAVGSSLVTTFFFMGLYRDTTDFKQIIGFENLIFILVRLSICQAAVLLLKPFMSGMFLAGQALSTLVMNAMGFSAGSAYGHLEPTSTYLADVPTLLMAGQLVGILFFIAALACGAAICFSVFQRLLKIIYAVPTGALAVATIAGGKELSHHAVTWLKEFIAVVLEATFMIMAIGIVVPFMGVNLFPGNDAVSSLMSIIEPAFKMVLMAGAIKGSSTIVRKYLGL